METERNGKSQRRAVSGIGAAPVGVTGIGAGESACLSFHPGAVARAMYDHETADLNRLWYLWTMPRVVEDQRRTFENEEFFVALSRLNEVKTLQRAAKPSRAEPKRAGRLVVRCLLFISLPF